jgi:hypothetical protein
MLEFLLNNKELQSSPSYFRSLKFFIKHPESLDLLIKNINLPLTKQYQILVNKGITKNGEPYSFQTIYNLIQFIKKEEVIKKYNEIKG